MNCPRCNRVLIGGLCKSCTVIKYATKRCMDASPVNPKRRRTSVIREAIRSDLIQDQHDEIPLQDASFRVFRPWEIQGIKHIFACFYIVSNQVAEKCA